jgi:hypothetical protein
MPNFRLPSFLANLSSKLKKPDEPQKKEQPKDSRPANLPPGYAGQGTSSAIERKISAAFNPTPATPKPKVIPKEIKELSEESKQQLERLSRVFDGQAEMRHNQYKYNSEFKELNSEKKCAAFDEAQHLIAENYPAEELKFPFPDELTNLIEKIAKNVAALTDVQHEIIHAYKVQLAIKKAAYLQSIASEKEQMYDGGNIPCRFTTKANSEYIVGKNFVLRERYIDLTSHHTQGKSMFYITPEVSNAILFAGYSDRVTHGVKKAEDGQYSLRIGHYTPLSNDSNASEFIETKALLLTKSAALGLCTLDLSLDKDGNVPNDLYNRHIGNTIIKVEPF